MDTSSTTWLPWLIPLFPLLGFLINAFLGAKLTKSPVPVVYTGVGAPQRPAHSTAGHDAHDDFHLSKSGMAIVGGLATAVLAASFAVALVLFMQVSGMHGETRQIFSTRFTWMQTPQIGSFQPLDLGFSLVIDPLTSLMLLIITGIGTLIHLYSMGYMSHDKGYARYFTYLNLFVFFMLLLVMGSNLLVLFVGWEGVGLASYLLIGFYSERKAANDAGKKAFIVNRIGDCALLIALFLIFKYFGTFEFYGPHGILTDAGMHTASGNGYISITDSGLMPIASLVPFLLFLGAAGKSAQIPLYIWLPDAMEGPTPVSALIHAATMVTGGVYLVARTHDLFLPAPGVLTIVAVVGLATAFLAATIGLVQNDIKRVLAYSTVSQLGYMFLACGVGAFGSAMFHVMTHAFFKALLFLGSGSVIHAMGGEQDMRKMGGLGQKIKLTFAAMLIGTLAISGIPPFAGFWSKDEILLNAFAGSDVGGLGHWSLWLGGVIVSAMTAFYMVRLMMKTFGGRPRYSDEVGAHIHESPPSMVAPLLVLGLLSMIGGFFNAAPLHMAYLDTFLGSTVNWRDSTSNMPLKTEGIETPLLMVSIAVALVFCLAAFFAYRGKPAGELSTQAAKDKNPVWKLLYNKWGVDETYDSVFVRPGIDLARGLWRVVDLQIVDGAVKGISGVVSGLANGIKGWQSGYVRSYSLSMLIGVVVVVAGCLIGMSGLMR